MHTVHDWLTSPIGVFVLFWFVLLPVCTHVFKKRTPEEYSASAAREPRWFFARWTPLWQLAGGLSIDPQKVAEAALKMLTGRVQPLAIGIVEAKSGPTNPPPPPTPPPSPPPSGGMPIASVHELPIIDMGYGGDDAPDTEPETPAAKRPLRLVVLAAAASLALFLLVACSSAPTTPTQRAEQAEIAYGARLQACVAQAKSHMVDKSAASRARANAEADACAASVDAEWRIDAGAPLPTPAWVSSLPTPTPFDGGSSPLDAGPIDVQEVRRRLLFDAGPSATPATDGGAS